MYQILSMYHNLSFSNGLSLDSEHRYKGHIVMADLFRRTKRFLERITRNYYERKTPHIPSDFMLREFAAQTWHSKSYIRHMAFQSIEEIKKFLVTKAPRHFYYSSARYNQPEANDMELKGWRSADLVFDIDADHLPECTDKVIEIKIEASGEKTSLVDDECIERASLRALILKDVLVYELGIDERRIAIEFSGNRGFHVTAYLDDSNELAKSGSDVRRELVNYIKAVDLLDESLEPWRQLSIRRGRPSPIPPSPLSGGVRGRLARIMVRLAQQRGLTGIVARLYKFQSQKTTVLYDNALKDLEQEARELIGVEIDEQVTIDTSRLIRAPWSLNGKTMLPVMPLDEHMLVRFKLSVHISPFANMEPVRVRMLTNIPTSIRILGTRMSLKKDDRPKLDAPLALYLLSRGLAVIEQEV